MALAPTDTGEKIALMLAEIVARTIEYADIGRLLVSGGETSRAVCRRLGVGVLEVGLPVDPGVPYGFPIQGPRAVVVLKSGNFGSRDFYLKVRGL